MQGPQTLRRARISTEDMPERDRISMLREQFGRTLFGLDISALPNIAFRSTLTAQTLPNLVITSCTGGGLREWRTRETIADARNDFVLVINLNGPSVITQHGREFVMDEQTATLAALDAIGGITRPTLDHHLRILNIPRSTLALLVRNAENSIMRPVQSKSAALRLLIKYLDVLEAGREIEVREIAESISMHILDLTALVLGARGDHAELAKRRGAKAARLRAIRSDILDYLDRSDLSTNSIAALHGISPRYVRKLFEEDGSSFSSFVLTERLEKVRRLLADRRYAHLNIAQIAHKTGFGDISYFNRAFRRHFEATPSDFREEMKQGE
jgi:AraC-like DNA-binding protein